MSKKSTVNYDAISKYCSKPRTIHDIATEFGMSVQHAHRVTEKLIWAKAIVARLVSGNGAQRKLFLLPGLESENNWANINPLEGSLPAHDPFGIAKRRQL